MNTSSAKPLPLGTTPAFAGMHKWLQRGLFVCLTALVLEGAFTFPLLAIWYGWPKLSLQEICGEFEKIRFADESRECKYPYPLFAAAEGAGQKTAQDVWGVQPKPLYKKIEYRELVRRHDERLARQAVESRAEPASGTQPATAATPSPSP
jgi:hypothetical protein